MKRYLSILLSVLMACPSWAIERNVASQKLTVVAIDSATGRPKTGDAGNITAYVSKDDGAVTVLGDTSATETDATNAKGVYLFDLTQAETSATKLVFSAKSGTAGIDIIPQILYTTAANESLKSVDASGRLDIVKIGGDSSTVTNLNTVYDTYYTNWFDATNKRVKADVTAWNATAVATPATAGIPDVNAKNINNVATTSIATINANLGTTQPINFFGTGASAYAKSDVNGFGGVAGTFNAGRPEVNTTHVGGTAQSAGNIYLELIRRAPHTTYFVATTGNDSNAGTLAAPFLTINAAVAVCRPGDVIDVGTGTFSGQVTLTSGIELVGVGPNTVLTYNSLQTLVTANNNIVRNLSVVTTDTASGIAIDSTNPFTTNRFENLVVTGGAKCWDLRYPQNTRISGCFITLNQTGVYQDHGELIVEGCRFVNVTPLLSGDVRGVTTLAETVTRIKDCVIQLTRGGESDTVTGDLVGLYNTAGNQYAENVYVTLGIDGATSTGTAYGAYQAGGGATMLDGGGIFTSNTAGTSLARDVYSFSTGIVDIRGTNVNTSKFAGTLNNIKVWGRRPIRSGMAQGGTSNTITLDSAASSTNDAYKGLLVSIPFGTGIGQSRQILSYNGTTKAATVDSAWTTNTTTGSYFELTALAGVVQTGDNFARLGAPIGLSLSADIQTRLPTSSYTAPPSAAANATAVRTELTTELARLDVAMSTRLATASYTAPNNAAAVAIQTVTDRINAMLESSGGHDRYKATAVETAPSGSGSGLTAQQTRDALKLAPTAGAPAAGSTDDVLNKTYKAARTK